MYKNVIAVLDGAAGSCGKAKVISELALDNYNDILASVSTCSPNAGHTVVLPNEKNIYLEIYQLHALILMLLYLYLLVP